MFFRRATQPPALMRRCLHCGTPIIASPRAMTAPCPGCGRSATLNDLVITGHRNLGTVRTCGRLIVEPRGRLTATLVEAGEGVYVTGTIQSNVITAGQVVIAAGARWNGDCHAASIEVMPGALVEGGRFEIGAVAAATP
jgi:cytoskeletal protein CcmA (bactofilin family)